MSDIDPKPRAHASVVGEFIDDAALMNTGRSIGVMGSFRVAQELLDSTDPAVHAAMLDALTRHGVLERRPVCHEPGFTHLVEVDWQEVTP